LDSITNGVPYRAISWIVEAFPADNISEGYGNGVPAWIGNSGVGVGVGVSVGVEVGVAVEVAVFVGGIGVRVWVAGMGANVAVGLDWLPVGLQAGKIKTSRISSATHFWYLLIFPMITSG